MPNALMAALDNADARKRARAQAGRAAKQIEKKKQAADRAAELAAAKAVAKAERARLLARLRKQRERARRAAEGQWMAKRVVAVMGDGRELKVKAKVDKAGWDRYRAGERQRQRREKMARDTDASNAALDELNELLAGVFGN